MRRVSSRIDYERSVPPNYTVADARGPGSGLQFRATADRSVPCDPFRRAGREPATQGGDVLGKRPVPPECAPRCCRGIPAVCGHAAPAKSFDRAAPEWPPPPPVPGNRWLVWLFSSKGCEARQHTVQPRMALDRLRRGKEKNFSRPPAGSYEWRSRPRVRFRRAEETRSLLRQSD